MAERFTRTILSFLIVLSAYWLYALLFVPLIDPRGGTTVVQLPSQSPSVTTPAPKPTDQFQPLLTPLFPRDSWELNKAMVLKNDQFILLVGSIETLNNGSRLRLDPCTVVLNPQAAQNDALTENGGCIILNAPGGAELDFDRPFKPISGRLGKLLGGRLLGEVSIRSHTPPNSSQPSAASPLEIDTRNVQMNSQQIWTRDEVEFRYGQNFGRGRYLMINLNEAETSDLRRLPSDNPSHLRSLELVHLDQLTVTTSQSSITDSSPTNPTILKVHCEGQLLFDFVGGSVTLEDHVAIQRVGGRHAVARSSAAMDGQSDWLTCELLTLQFQAQSNQEQLPSKQSSLGGRPQPRWELPEFQLSHIGAFGNPAVVDVPSNNMRAQAGKIELDLLLNTLHLQDPNQAVLRYDAHTFRATSLNYFFDPQGGPGRAEVTGGGQYEGSFDGDVAQLQWRKGLKFGPRDGMYLLEVDGDAWIHWKQKSTMENAISNSPPSTSSQSTAESSHQLAAGLLQVWLRQTSDLGATQSNTINTDDLNDAAKLGRWRPERIIARKNVRLRTPQLLGDVEIAEVQLRRRLDSGEAIDGRTPFLDKIGGDDKAGNDDEAGPALFGPRGAEVAAKRPTEQYHLTGYEVFVALQSDDHNSSPTLESVVVKGDVHLRQVSLIPAVPDSPVNEQDHHAAGVEIKGSLVELNQSLDSTGAIGHVLGEPAMVKTQGAELVGRDIRMDQSQNRVWIDGAGSAFLPLPQRVATQFQRRTATARITWQGGMQFDGKSITCEQDIEIRGPAQIATADTLRATLAEPIQFDASGRQRQAANPTRSPQPQQGATQVLAEVSLVGNVRLENRSYDDHGMTSIDELFVRSLSYDQTTGQLVGIGPGWISSVRQANQTAMANPLGTANGRSSQVVAQQASSQQASVKFTHTYIEFQKRLSGSLAAREVSVFDRVRAIHGPVENTEQRIHFDDPNRSPETIAMRATRLTVAQMLASGIPSLEFNASGNTEIVGNTFTAIAEHVRYSQARDALVLEGDGRGGATISHQQRIGAPRSKSTARKITYLIRQKKLDVDGLTFGDVNNPVASQPNPRSFGAPGAITNGAGWQNGSLQQQPVFGRHPQPDRTNLYEPRN